MCSNTIAMRSFALRHIVCAAMSKGRKFIECGTRYWTRQRSSTCKQQARRSMLTVARRTGRLLAFVPRRSPSDRASDANRRSRSSCMRSAPSKTRDCDCQRTSDCSWAWCSTRTCSRYCPGSAARCRGAAGEALVAEERHASRLRTIQR